MGFIKTSAKRTRQQRLAGTNQRLVDILNTCERKVDKYEKILLEYAKESNWCIVPKSTDGQETTSVIAEWLGPGNGPSLAQDVFKMPMANPESGKVELTLEQQQLEGYATDES